MKKTIFTYLIGILMLSGCSNKSTEPDYVGTSTFPLTTDSRWVYERNYSEVSIIDSALVNTESYSIIRHIIGPDTVIDGNQLIAVDDSVARSDSIDQDPYVNRHLYCISEGQLKEYGQITIFQWGEVVPVYYNPPHVLLEFPLTNNRAWLSYEAALGNVYNTVVGIQYVDVGQQSIKCDVVRSQLIDPGTGHRYYDSHWWYSNDGLIRNEFDYGLREITDELGHVIDTVQVTDVMELTEFQIQSE
ncbi:MAG: hypothetical protein V3W18_09440 [candidate division Zixibacteria bacterium]